MTAEQIHQLGLQEVARIEKEMEQLARADWLQRDRSPSSRSSSARRPGMRFTSQAEMIQYAREVLARLQPALPRLFLRVPKMAVDVRPIPAGSRSVHGVELHRGYRRRHAAGVVQHEHLSAAANR